MIRHFTASGIVLSDEHVLLVEHRKLGWWLYPGGHIEPDEDPAQAVIREVTEETGTAARSPPSPGSATPPPPCPAPFTICVQDIPADATHNRPAGCQAGSRPVKPMSRSSSGADSGTVTGGPNSPSLPFGFCATADCANA